MYIYFVGYTFEDRRGHGAGQAEVPTPRPIKTIEDVNQLQEAMRARQGMDQLVITGFSLLREE